MKNKVTAFDAIVVLTVLVFLAALGSVFAWSGYSVMSSEIDKYNELRELRKPISYTDTARDATIWQEIK